MNKTKLILLTVLFLSVIYGCNKDKDDSGYTYIPPAEEQGNNTLTPIYPKASFTVSVNGMTVTVRSNSTNAKELTWSWGDGLSSYNYTTCSHTYTSARTYTIQLLVISSTGHSDLASASVVIKKPAPTQVKITSLVLNEFPAAPSSGAWDVAGKPDIYFKLMDGNGTTTYYKSETKDDVSNYNCPIYYTGINYTLYNVTAKYLFRFYDEDITGDEYMFGIYWTPSTQSNNYSSYYNLLQTNIDFTVYMTWYSTKGEALYTKSANCRNGEWKTDDPEVKEALGL